MLLPAEGEVEIGVGEDEKGRSDRERWGLLPSALGATLSLLLLTSPLSCTRTGADVTYINSHSHKSKTEQNTYGTLLGISRSFGLRKIYHRTIKAGSSSVTLQFLHSSTSTSILPVQPMPLQWPGQLTISPAYGHSTTNPSTHHYTRTQNSPKRPLHTRDEPVVISDEKASSSTPRHNIAPLASASDSLIGMDTQNSLEVASGVTESSGQPGSVTSRPIQHECTGFA